ncbi:Diadenosine polyphosphate hydrolase and related proteins of the histidine triad (HIT) family [Phaffia rhodozyma]|uniref:Bis(5'-adenosyl)-triphosphatase n=1 Tax=Phaffia rhodozyma TaxID=264483 RepID=A0A0F7SEN3_PHARH|nr:Diadenosine polyphosphate hydrolase and related proteins of the histidine triad (HIT) family [Phaffia rhodozyma]
METTEPMSPVTSQVFYRSKLSFGLVNLKPILPGHVLICPLRVVPRVADLSAEEIADLYLAVQKIGTVIERAYGGEALTISTQDGPAAGQSVPHVHVHVLPRKPTDFNGENDEVYPVLELAEDNLLDDHQSLARSNGEDRPRKKAGSIKVDADENRPPRSLEDMEKEARWLEQLLAADRTA